MDPTLFAALTAGATVVTANQRLARQWQADFSRRMRQEGRTAWASPDILPWQAWIERTWNESFGLALADPARARHVLLSQAQEQRLWENIIADSAWRDVLLQVPAAARTAREAWQLAWEWGLPLPREADAPNEDVRAFATWADAFERECRQWCWQDRARVPELLAAAYRRRQLETPAQLLLVGFDELTPQQQRLFDALREAGARIATPTPPGNTARAVRIACQDAREEIALAARWARRLLGDRTDARIGIVVPDLATQRAMIVREFDEVFVPAAAFPGGAAVRPYNLSLGRPLRDCPPVHAAFQILTLAQGKLDYTAAGSLLRSPFLAGAETELSRRALLDAELRRLGETTVGLGLLARHAHTTHPDGTPAAFAAPVLAGLLKQLRAVTDSLRARQLPSDWAESFARLLTAVGWPGERTLTSEEYQAIEAWRELVAQLAEIDTLSDRIEAHEALTTLRRLAGERIFQPRTPETPVQILGALEAAGLAFDHLWVMGLHDGVWPQGPRPNPFLPLASQRRHGLPHASAERELAFARRLTERLLASAPEVIVSHPARTGDEDLRPSPLIAVLPVMDRRILALAAVTPVRDVIHAAHAIETLVDSLAPELPAETPVRRGTAVFRDQAACPFRAFARARLGATPLGEPQPGIDDSLRGILLHGVLARVWRELKTHATLCASTPAALQTLVQAHVEAEIEARACDRRATFTVRFTQLEQQRLAALVLEWLALEKQRAPFTVIAAEQSERIGFGGLTVEARVDRMDELEHGVRAVIDYKTGNPKLSQWFGERPDEPQLPLYSAARERVGAVMFARLRRGDMGFAGMAMQDGWVPGVGAIGEVKEAAAYGSWESLLDDWRRVLNGLGEAFRRGDARVDPKQPPQTCEYCGLKPLCRVHERAAAARVEPEEAAP